MIQSSFPKDQIISYNKTVVEILSKISSLTTTTDSSVNVQIYDENGILRISHCHLHIIEVRDRLSNNINSLYGIDAGGSLIQTTSENKFKR
jgi:hypothetical protein